MPLPKPPAKRADFLSRADFESQAAARPASARGRAQPGGRAGRAGACSSCRTRARCRPRRRSRPRRRAAAPRAGRGRRRAAPSARSKPRGNGPATLFVLDTNVLMHDPTSLFRFDEHDIYLPMITLEELDGHKRGMTEVARNARQVSRDLDALAANMPTRDAAGPLGRHRRSTAPATARPAASCSSRPT